MVGGNHARTLCQAVEHRLGLLYLTSGDPASLRPKGNRTGPRRLSGVNSIPTQGAAIPPFQDENSDQADLRGGASPWFNRTRPILRIALTENLSCDALIVGCGITGALMAERLTRQGLAVVLIDRDLPGRGSTAASTAMLLWEIDRSLVQLTNAYGFERAARAYQASLQAVSGLTKLGA